MQRIYRGALYMCATCNDCMSRTSRKSFEKHDFRMCAQASRRAIRHAYAEGRRTTFETWQLQIYIAEHNHNILAFWAASISEWHTLPCAGSNNHAEIVHDAPRTTYTWAFLYTTRLSSHSCTGCKYRLRMRCVRLHYTSKLPAPQSDISACAFRLVCHLWIRP